MCIYIHSILFGVYGNDPEKNSLPYLFYFIFALIVTTVILTEMIIMCQVHECFI